MSKKVIISSDSTVDLSEELIKKHGISISHMPITVGDKQYTDGVDIFPQDLFEYTRATGQLAKTSALNTASFTDYFSKLAADGDEVVHFCISASMSGSYNFARLAAEEMQGIYVIDSANLSTGIGLLVLEACELAEQGKSGAEIVEQIEKLKPCVDASFVIDTLEFLHKGGRCSTVAMLGANMLKLKPCIEVTNGAMTVGKKYRGKLADVLKTYAQERFANPENAVDKRAFVTHTCEDDSVAEGIADYVRSTGIFKEVIVTKAGCTISAHCGPNTLGVLYIRKTPKE